jgi:hypothetical protein
MLFCSDDDNVLEQSMNSPNARPKTATNVVLKDPELVNVSTVSRKSSSSPTTDFLNEVLNEVESIDRMAIAPQPSRRPSIGDVAIFDNCTQQLADTQDQDAIVYQKLESNSNEPRPAFNVLQAAQVLSVKTKCIRIEFDSTWGDHDHVGLSGIEVLGIDGKAITLTAKQLSFDSSSDLFGTASSGDRRIDNVINGLNNTANDGFMWLAQMPFQKNMKQFLEIKLFSETVVVGFR